MLIDEDSGNKKVNKRQDKEIDKSLNDYLTEVFLIKLLAKSWHKLIRKTSLSLGWKQDREGTGGGGASRGGMVRNGKIFSDSYMMHVAHYRGSTEEKQME